MDQLSGIVASLMERARSDLAHLVAFPSVFDPSTGPSAACDDAAAWVADAFREAGIDDVEASRTSDGSLAVHGHAPGPPGTPTVLLYSHYDVQPALGEDAWRSPVWELTERDGRWYGRGAADCKGSVVMHLTALRALRAAGGALPCGVKVVCEGSEELGGAGLEAFVPEHAERLRADAVLVADAGNPAVGVPALTTSLRGMALVDVRVRALGSAVHSGSFGGAAPDPIVALLAMLASLHDESGDTTVDGLEGGQAWAGADYPAERFRADATVLDGVELIGSGSIADMVWARPSVTVLGLDVPPVRGSVAAVQAEAGARLSIRVPAGNSARAAQDALVEHLRRRVPWGLQVELTRGDVGEPFATHPGGRAFELLRGALEQASGQATVVQGEGASIPLCNVLARTYPDAEILLFGIDEPSCRIHAPNESIDPREIERVALAEALFLQSYAAGFKP